MGSIRALRFGSFSIRDYVDAIRETEPERCALIPDHNVPNGNQDLEASDLEGLKQHENEPEDDSASELEEIRQHENEPEDASASELEGLKQDENEPEDASASELEGLKQDENEPEDASASELGLKQHGNKPEDATEIIIISDSDDDTTISDLPVEFVKSPCSNDRTVNEGASNENSIPAATDDGSSRRKLKKMRRKLKKLRRKLKKIKKPRRRLIVDIYKELDERKVKSDVLGAPKRNSDGHAGPSTLKSNSDGHAGPSAPQSNSDGHVGPSAPKSNSDGHAGPSAPKSNSDGHAGPSAQLTIELRNDSDDVTLKSLRKRKAAHCNRNKKQKALKAKVPKLNESETSNHGPKGLNSHGPFATGKLQEAECSGSGACDGLGGSEPSGSGSVVGRLVGLGGSEPSGSGSVVGRLVATAGELKGSTGPEVDAARAVEHEVLVCSLNQNPTDFIMSFESGYFRTL